MIRISVLLFVMLLAAAIATQPASAADAPMSAIEASKYVDAVCGSTLPSFRGFEKKAKGLGFKVVPKGQDLLDGTPAGLRAIKSGLAVYIDLYTLGDGTTVCMVTYGSNENARSYFRNLGSVYDLKALDKTGKYIRYRDTSAALIITEGRIVNGPIKWLWIGVAVSK